MALHPEGEAPGGLVTIPCAFCPDGIAGKSDGGPIVSFGVHGKPICSACLAKRVYPVFPGVVGHRQEGFTDAEGKEWG